jgi:membrane protein implicated in regulation of membrane protease activity
MSMKVYVMFNIATGLLKGAVLAAIVLWLLPSLWGFNIPMWGLILLMVVFVIYEVVTFRLGRRALARKPTASPQAIVGCRGKATTPLTPDGYVQIEGELWHALSSDTNINKGDDIVVVEVNRLTLRVAPLSGTMMGPSVKPDTESD